MPLYEYECTQCGERKDILMSYDEWDGVVTFPLDKIICLPCDVLMSRRVSLFSFALAQPDTAKSKVNPKARQVRI